jgi:hypothetical protein
MIFKTTGKGWMRAISLENLFSKEMNVVSLGLVTRRSSDQWTKIVSSSMFERKHTNMSGDYRNMPFPALDSM